MNTPSPEQVQHSYVNEILPLFIMWQRVSNPKQTMYLHDYIVASKPLITFLITNHAFDTRGNAPEGYAEWQKLDPEILGGNYHGHHGNGPKCTVTMAAGAAGHPILAGVKLPLLSNGSLYEVRPLAESTKRLLVGTIPDKEPEPVAWTNQYKQSRIFYTSLGHPDDFKNEPFRRMLINAVFWAMDKPVPKAK